MDSHDFPSEAYDQWKTTPPAEYELGRPLQPSDPCECGHDYDEHNGKELLCWKCPDLDQVCDGFELDWDELIDREKAEAENRGMSEAKGEL